MRRSILASLCFALLASSATAVEKDSNKPADGGKSDAKGIAFFETKIRPVLVKHCYSCHSTKAKNVKGGLLLDSREGLRKGGESGPAFEPGNDKDSLLMEALRQEGLEMPPQGKLPDSVIADFSTWIRLGAPDPRTSGPVIRKGPIDFDKARQFWAFQPPHQMPPPAVKNTAWPMSDVDRFVLATLEAKGLSPANDADRRTLIRRTSFALTGLPPSPSEIQAFVDDKSSGAFAKVVDRLLNSPQFGERWGRHWLDVARYAESAGKERNRVFPQAWRYRDYVIDAFNKDKPYDRFIIEQIAGDLLPAKDDVQRNEQIIATGFLVIGPKGLNERNREKYLMDVVDDQIDTSCRAMIGVTVACARCHDHKFDPIPTTDYYAMAGIFRSSETLAGVSGGKRKKNGGGLFPLAVKSGDDKPEDAKANKAQADRVKTLTLQLRQTQTKLKRLKSSGKGKGKNRKSKKGQNKKARSNRAEIVKTQRQLKRLQAQLKQLRQKGPALRDVAMAMRDSSSPSDCQVCIRGEVTSRGPSVPRGFVTVISDGKSKISSGSGRLELAQWFASRDNPLTARVMVNRIWRHLFGAGLVKTCDNFGALGERPTHPKLLDHLAVKFMEDGWSVKRAIRRIMLSHVFQLSSEHHAANFEVDPENRYLWRMSRQRLEAEAIRDAILAASGQLDLRRPFGSPVMRLGNGEIGRGVNLGDVNRNHRNRSVYLPIVRQAMPDVLSLFDAADPSLVVGSRDATTVATQALFMMNSPFVQSQAMRMAELLLVKKGVDDAGRMVLAHELSLSRPPTRVELDRGLSFLREYRLTLADRAQKEAVAQTWASYCQALFASAEFRYVY